MSSKNLYRKIALVVFPIMLQNVLSAAVNSADVLMLNSVRQNEISAVWLSAPEAGRS